MRWKGDGNVRMMRGVRIREIISWRGREGVPLDGVSTERDVSSVVPYSMKGRDVKFGVRTSFIFYSDFSFLSFFG